MDTLDPTSLRAACEYAGRWLDVNFRNSSLPALHVAIQHRDELLLAKAFGHANLERGEPLTSEHAFRIGSHSKTFTATALMQLKERGRLQLDDPVSRHLAWFRSSNDERVGELTLRQLMNHSAGLIRDGDEADYWQLAGHFPDSRELREYAATSSLVYDADEQFKYSNFGYGYLGLVIEAVSGLPYREYVTRNLVEPLGLSATGPDLDEKGRRLLACGYGVELFGGPRQVLEHVDTGDFAPATGFYSTATDLCAYFSAHFLGNTVLLSDASKRQMQQYNSRRAGLPERYGLGLAGYPREGWNVYGHNGGFPGFITSTQFDADKALVVSVLTNATDGPAEQICNGLLNLLDGFQRGAVADADALGSGGFCGRFFCTWGVLDIVRAGAKFLAFDPLWWSTNAPAPKWSDLEGVDELSPVDATTLRIDRGHGYGSPGETVRYEFDGDGTARSITYAGITMVPWNEAVRRGWFTGEP